jgi:hypothetical protein
MNEQRKAYRLMVEEPLGTPRCRWVDNIEMNLWEIGWRINDWVGLAQDRDRLGVSVIVVMKFQVP